MRLGISTPEVWEQKADHPGKMIPLKTVFVDNEIIPLVNWFNSICGVFTTFSCQGDEEGCAYICFMADEEGFQEINKLIYGVAQELVSGEKIELLTTLAFEAGKARTSYGLYFFSKSVLDKCMKWVANEHR